MTERLRARSKRLAPASHVGLLLAAACLWGCPESEGKAPTSGCHEAYDKCLLETGALGVCDVVPCAVGQAEPCLRCRSQH